MILNHREITCQHRRQYLKQIRWIALLHNHHHTPRCLFYLYRQYRTCNNYKQYCAKINTSWATSSSDFSGIADGFSTGEMKRKKIYREGGSQMRHNRVKIVKHSLKYLGKFFRGRVYVACLSLTENTMDHQRVEHEGARKSRIPHARWKFWLIKMWAREILRQILNNLYLLHSSWNFISSE